MQETCGRKKTLGNDQNCGKRQAKVLPTVFTFAFVYNTKLTKETYAEQIWPTSPSLF